MRVSAWRNGNTASSIYGIRVWLPDRRRFFDSSWTDIEVEIDGQPHRFTLPPRFWRACPEFRDRSSNPVIREWLRRHHGLDWAKGEPPHVELIPLGGNRFRLVA